MRLLIRGSVVLLLRGSVALGGSVALWLCGWLQVGTTWEWHDNGDLSTRTAAVPAVRVNPRTGKKVFFNSVVAAYTGWVGE